MQSTISRHSACSRASKKGCEYESKLLESVTGEASGAAASPGPAAPPLACPDSLRPLCAAAPKCASRARLSGSSLRKGAASRAMLLASSAARAAARRASRAVSQMDKDRLSGAHSSRWR
eukprot:scaffold5475_cov127-Isochrysis_galbana.AAC.8